MVSRRIFLDLDQVLVDFVTGVCRAIDFPYSGVKDWQDHWPYNFFKHVGTTREEADKLCTTDLWANLPWTEDGQEIYQAVLEQFHRCEIAVLTKPMRNPESYTGKILWARKNIPELADRMVPTEIPKSYFACGFETLLIDDCDDNIEEFIRDGGAGILVPRPWNKSYRLCKEGKSASHVAEMMDRWADITKGATCLK